MKNFKASVIHTQPNKSTNPVVNHDTRSIKAQLKILQITIKTGWLFVIKYLKVGTQLSWTFIIPV